jgi:hypothetical protein
MIAIHEIKINAEIQKVWDISIDIDHWKDWTPTIDESCLLTKPFNLGAKAKIKQPDQPASVWTVNKFDDGKSFSWFTKIAGIHMTATHQLTSKVKGQTSNKLIFETKGILSFILWPFIKSKIQDSLKKENEGLKKYCENN